MNGAAESDDLMTGDEVMKRLADDPRLRRVALSCVLTAIACGDEWRFRRSELESWIARQLSFSPEEP